MDSIRVTLTLPLAALEFPQTLSELVETEYPSVKCDITARVNKDTLTVECELNDSSRALRVEAFNYMLGLVAAKYKPKKPDPINLNIPDAEHLLKDDVGVWRVEAFLRQDHMLERHQQLKQRIQNSLKCIELAQERYQGWPSLAFSYNGGKDCQVLMHLLSIVRSRQHLNFPIRTVYILPLKKFWEMETFAKVSARRYNFTMQEIPSPMRTGLQQYLDSSEIHVKAIFVGTRKTDPYAQHLQPFTPTDAGWPQFMRVNPILEWSYADVWLYLILFEVEYCELYDRGYTSLGGVDETVPNPNLMDPASPCGYRNACELEDHDGTQERAGRIRNF